ncbi:hypothetical protein C8Q79DRAFT_38300 [Trametes meyenii]|nr:hypothetical protein C8Q79DRAFT_38300 [Trametes meyenii]
MAKQKFYAVHNGRQGTQIYTTWEETKANVSRFSGAIHKSFRSLPEARAWLLGIADAAAADVPPPYSYPSARPSQLEMEPPTQAGISQMPVSRIKEEVDDLVEEEFFNPMEVDGQPGPNRSTQPPPIPQDVVMQTQVPPVPAPAPAEEIKLSPDQQRVLDMVKQGKSVFFTGSAGTGKSVLLREIIKLRGGRPSLRLGVTASTGIASVNIGGCTLHSWAGIGLGKEDKERLVGKILGISFKELKRERLEKQKRDILWARHRRGELLTPEEEQFMRAPQPPQEERKSRVLDRWRECRTLIIDEKSP